jgi:hypothetical protein
MVAPVAFDAEAFSFWSEVDKYLSANVPDYITANLLVNGEMVFKPYTDSPPLSRAPGRKKGAIVDKINEIEFLKLVGPQDDALGVARVGKTDLKGLLDLDSGIAGIRLRAGNIGIGDSRSLVECFPKSDERFVHYLLGEVHAVAENLIPNARRDGFEHGEARHSLFEACAREIAVPYRKKIREASAGRSVQRAVQEAQSVRTDAEEAISRGMVTEEERRSYAESVSESQEKIRGLGQGVQRVIEELEETGTAVESAPRLVDLQLTNE